MKLLCMGKYTLPEMPYAYDALEPHIDAQTMEIHHSKHHQKYTDGMNGALEKLSPCLLYTSPSPRDRG